MFVFAGNLMGYSFLDSHFGRRPVAVVDGSSVANTVYEKYARNLKLMKPENETWAIVGHVTDAYTPHSTESHELNKRTHGDVARYLEEAALPVFVSINN